MNDTTQYRRSFALLIGIDSYASSKFPPLTKAEEDMRCLADLLASEPYAFETYLLLGAEATRENIIAYLHYLEQETNENDRVLIAYAGHGFTLPDRFDAETGYLTAYDSDPDNHHTAIKMGDVTDFRRFSDARHIGFIFDACFSGQALGITRSSGAETQLMMRTAFQVISAGAADQTVSDYYSMTSHLVRLLRNPNQMLTMNRLGHAIQQTITQLSQGMQIPQFGHITGSEGGDLIFYTPEGLDMVSLLPERLRSGLRSASAETRYFAIAELERSLYDAQLTVAAHATLEEIATSDADVDVRRRALKAITRYYSSGNGGDFNYSTPNTEVTAINGRKANGTKPFRRGRTPRLVIYYEEGEVEVPLEMPRLTLGRSSEADVHIEHTSVSRHHALLMRDGTRYMLEDLQSTNGTFVNGERITGKVYLTHGARIQLAHCHLRYFDANGTDSM
jgi:hypothetical protein